MYFRDQMVRASVSAAMICIYKNRHTKRFRLAEPSVGIRLGCCVGWLVCNVRIKSGLGFLFSERSCLSHQGLSVSVAFIETFSKKYLAVVVFHERKKQICANVTAN